MPIDTSRSGDTLAEIQRMMDGIAEVAGLEKVADGLPMEPNENKELPFEVQEPGAPYDFEGAVGKHQQAAVNMAHPSPEDGRGGNANPLVRANMNTGRPNQPWNPVQMAYSASDRAKNDADVRQYTDARDRKTFKINPREYLRSQYPNLSDDRFNNMLAQSDANARAAGFPATSDAMKLYESEGGIPVGYRSNYPGAHYANVNRRYLPNAAMAPLSRYSASRAQEADADTVTLGSPVEIMKDRFRKGDGIEAMYNQMREMQEMREENGLSSKRFGRIPTSEVADLSNIARHEVSHALTGRPESRPSLEEYYKMAPHVAPPWLRSRQDPRNPVERFKDYNKTRSQLSNKELAAEFDRHKQLQSRRMFPIDPEERLVGLNQGKLNNGLFNNGSSRASVYPLDSPSELSPIARAMKRHAENGGPFKSATDMYGYFQRKDVPEDVKRKAFNGLDMDLKRLVNYWERLDSVPMAYRKRVDPQDLNKWVDYMTPMVASTGQPMQHTASLEKSAASWLGAVPPSDVAAVVRRAARAVPREALADKGVEDSPHVTLKYDVHTDDPTELAGSLPDAEVAIGAPDWFEPAGKPYSVLKFPVVSAALSRAHRKLRRLNGGRDTHPSYSPHMTVAYVRKDADKGEILRRVSEAADLDGTVFKVHHYRFSDSDDRETHLPKDVEQVDNSTRMRDTIQKQIEKAAAIYIRKTRSK